MPKILKIVCFSLLILGVLSFAFPAFTQGGDSLVDCRKGRTYCEYPGECRDYIDKNKDGYCDLSIPRTVSSATTSNAAATAAGTKLATAAASTPSTNSVQSNSSGSLDAQSSQNKPAAPVYNLLLIILIVAALYMATYLLTRTRVITYPVHTKIWNIVLLVSTLAMLILGLLLTLEIDYRMNIVMPFDMTYWHVELGIIMGVIAAFHIAWHWRYFARLLKLRKSAAG